VEPKSALKVDEINLSDPEFWRRPREEREGAFQTLRREHPITYFEEPETEWPRGAGYWAVTHHAHILEASRQPELYCSGKGATAIPDIPEDLLQFFGSFINMDDPAHGRLRRLVSNGFTPKRLKRLEEFVERQAIAVVDAVLERGECDFVTEIAAPFPIRIICDMLGIPASQYDFVFERTNVILGAEDPDYVPEGADPNAALVKAAMELVALMNDLRERRLKTPTDDLTSVLVHAEVDGDRLSQEELGAFFILLVAAGNETTRNAISHGMKALCDYPEQRARWRADFDGLARSAVEEIVRWASPVIFMRRTTTAETELGGQKLAAGEKIVLFYNSGNRDEAKFDDPYQFDVRRWPNEHVGFGGPGPHFCLGANLARREIQVMFRQLLTRLSDLEVVGQPDYLFSMFINGIKRMPCRFTPGRPSAR